MKKNVIITCFTVLLLNVLCSQTHADLEAAINATGSRNLTLTNNVTFDFGRYGTKFDNGGVLTLEGNVADAFNNNPSNAFSLTSSTGAFLDVFDTSTLNLNNIKISGNTSTGTNFITNNGVLNIKNSIISENLSGQDSSVISNSGNLFVDSSLFENNSIAVTGNNPNGLGRGAAIRNSGNALITNSTFRSNSSQHGSAIYNTETGFMEIRDSIFENNVSTNGSNYSYGSIFNQGTLIVKDSLFQNNTMGSGGGIYNEGNVAIYNSRFIANTATGLGGGVNNAKQSTLSVYNSEFDGNKATSASAAINSSYGGNVNIIGTTIQNHKVISDVDPSHPNYDRDNGGAMYFYGVEFLRDENYHLILDENGHAIVKTPSGHLYIENSKFLNNIVSRGGGAVYSTGYATIINTLFEGNSSDLKDGLENADAYNAGTAGAFYDYNFTDLPTIIKGSTFRNNSAYSAGAIYHPAGHLIIDSTLFDGNSAIDVGGGGALMNGGVGSLVLTNSRFIGNRAGLGGALSQMSENSAYIANSYFEKNTAAAYGGALYLRPYENSDTPENVKTDTYIISSHFFQNSSEGSGGAIYLQSDLDITTSTFVENTASTGTGGAMYILAPSIANITSTIFSNNSAENGGAIHNNGSVRIYNSIFEKNIAGESSAIRNQGTLSVYNSVFRNNISTYDSSKTYALVTGVIDGNGTTNVYNSSFLHNFHSSSNKNYYSGAITGRGVVNIIADNGISLISGNTSNGTSSGIFVRPDTGINLFAGTDEKTTGTIVINDSISIMSNGNLHLNKENNEGFATNGVIEINDEIKHLGGEYNSDFFINLYNGTLKLGTATVNYDFNNDGQGDGEVTSYGNITDRVTFNVYGGKLSTADGFIRNTNLGKLVLHDNVLYDLDVDLLGAVSDKPTATSIESNGKSLLIDTIHILEDSDTSYTEVKVTDGSVPVKLSDTATHAYSPMYSYTIDGSKLSTRGILSFTSDRETYLGYNPSLYASSIALQTGNHLSLVSHSLKKVSTDNVGLLNQLTITPHVSFEVIHLNGGYEIENTMYGSSIDFSIKNNILLSASYAGSYQGYKETDLIQNGAILGASHFFNVGTFFANTSLALMGNFIKAQTMHGSEFFPIISTALGSNLGFIISFTDNFRLIPSVFSHYVLSKTFDYESASALSIHNKIMHNILIAPELRFELTIDSTLNAYAHVQGNFPIQFGGDTLVNSVTIPKMNMGNYLFYGLGVKKQLEPSLNVKAEISGYNISRTGVEIMVSVFKSL